MIFSNCSFARRCLVIALACVILLYSVLPVPARADPVTASVVGVSAALAVATALISIGVRPLVDASLEACSELVDDIVAALPSEFFAATAVAGTFLKTILSNGVT